MTLNPQAVHWIDGTASNEAAATLDVLDPATGSHVVDLPVANASLVDRAVKNAHAAFLKWGALAHGRRSKMMLDFADALEADVDNLVALESLDMGKPLFAARQEVGFAIDLIRFAAGASRSLGALGAGEYLPGKTSFVRREPLGVIGGITPWNYPMVMMAYKVAASLAAGNTIVLKPAEQTPLSTVRVGELAAATLGPGILNVILGDGETTGAALVAHPGIALVTFTGETTTGKVIARSAADTLKRTVLELGGKSPVLVFDDADIEAVAQGVRHGGFYNAGQDCTAASRVIVQAGAYDELVERLVATVPSIKVGAPDEDAEIGPVVSAEQRDRIMGFLDRAVDSGLTLACGGNVLDRPGYFIEPTVVTGAAQDSEIIQREVFGPVVTVQRAETEEDMVAMANGTDYGLGASVWTRNVGRVAELTGRIEAGAVWVNCHDIVTPEMPHGGVRASGYGKDLSLFSITEMTHVKHVMLNHDR